MTDYKTIIQNHSYKVEFIRNSTGVVFTPPIVSGWYLNKLCEIGEAEIALPNEWVRDSETGQQKHPLREISAKLADVIQIWRDSELVFSGVVRRLTKRFDTLTFYCKSQLWWLTTQHTLVERYTEEPATTVGRFLVGWDYWHKDDFNRAAIGSDYTFEAPWTINSNQLYISDTSGAYKDCYYNTNNSNWDNAIIEFDLTKNFDTAHYLRVLYSLVGDPTDALGFTYYQTSATNRIMFVEYDDIHHRGITKIELDDSTQTKIRIVSRTVAGTTTVKVSMDGIEIINESMSKSTSTARFELQSRVDSASDWIKIDNLKIYKEKQLISEGTLDSFGSSKTTSVSYETLFNAIDQRTRRQLNSTDDLNSYWEFFENPVAYVDSTTPGASLDFSERIGSNKNIILSIDEKNLKNFESVEDWDAFATDVIALGAGTSEMDAAGQSVARSSDFDAYDDILFIKEVLYQLSEETNFSNLQTLATLWLGRRTTFHENIKVDPIDYEKRGFQIGDAYKIDIEQLGLDTSTYYRIINEKRSFSQEGSEALVVNWKDKTRSFIDTLRAELRQQLNKARYGQGNYVDYNISYLISVAVADDAYSDVRYFKFNSEIHLAVKKAWFNVDIGAAVNWIIEIDGIDRTDALFGSAEKVGDALKIDITAYVTSIAAHSIRIQNKEGSAQNIATWGEAQVYVR